MYFLLSTYVHTFLWPAPVAGRSLVGYKNDG
jgi:hypothetical protein